MQIIAFVDPNAGHRTSSYVVAANKSGCYLHVGSTGAVTRLAGLAAVEDRSAVGAALTESFQHANTICVDPLNPNRYYLADQFSVCVLDRTSSDVAAAATVTLLAGSRPGYADGLGSNASFHAVNDIVCTNDGSTLFVTDFMNARLRAIKTKTGDVTTAAGDGRHLTQSGYGVTASLYYVHNLAFDRAADVDGTAAVFDDSVLYISTERAILRFDRKTGYVGIIELNHSHASDRSYDPYGIAVLPSGRLLFACGNTSSIYVLDLSLPPDADGGWTPELVAGCAGAVTRAHLDGSALDGCRFVTPAGVRVVDSERCVLIADMDSNAIRRLTLSPHHFTPRAAADAAPRKEFTAPIKPQ